MADALSVTTPFSPALLAAVGLFIALLLALLALTLRQRARLTRMAQNLEAALAQGLERVEDELLAQSAQQREELSLGFNRMNDGLLSMMSSVMKMQGDQVNALLKQSYDSAQAFDRRQQTMQRITEESLRRMESSFQGADARVSALLNGNDARMESLRKSMEEAMRRLNAENARQLEEMRKTVDEKLHSALEKRLNASFQQVSERLEQVYKSLGEMHALASGVGDLKKMLGNVKARGVWGEMQLGALLSQALTSTQYEQNVAVTPGSQDRVEYAVCLPGRDGDAKLYLPIDSKFPMEDYARLVEASESGDAAQTDAAQKALLTAVRVEARRIGKYISPPDTTDFAVMFLPLEGLYAEVMRHADAVEQLQREQRVLIAGPSTLLALLNSLQMGFRTLAIERRSAEVWKLLGAVKADFGGFELVLKQTQQRLKQATESIDSAFVKTRGIEKRLRDVEALEEQ